MTELSGRSKRSVRFLAEPTFKHILNYVGVASHDGCGLYKHVQGNTPLEYKSDKAKLNYDLLSFIEGHKARARTQN